MLIKEFCHAKEGGYHLVLRESSYGSQLIKFLTLFDIAKKDFPKLNPYEVRVVKYGGERYAKTFGIEFYSLETPPSEYREIPYLEYES